MTMSLIETVTVGAGGAASIEFTSIPQDGTDLLLLVSGRSSANQTIPARMQVFLNSNIGSGSRTLWADGATVSSLTGQRNPFPAALSTTNTFGSLSAYISNYTATGIKSVSTESVAEINSSTNYGLAIGVRAYSGVTIAVTQILLNDDFGGNFVENSVASLYKITKGSDGSTVVS